MQDIPKAGEPAGDPLGAQRRRLGRSRRRQPRDIDLEGRLIKDGVRKALCERQNSLGELIDAFRQYRKLADKTPLTLQGSDFAHAVQELDKAD